MLVKIDPIPVSTDVGIAVPELDTLSNKIKKQVTDLPDIVSTDEAYRNAMKNSDKQNAALKVTVPLRRQFSEQSIGLLFNLEKGEGNDTYRYK